MWLIFVWLGLAAAAEAPSELPDVAPPTPIKPRRSTEALAQRLQTARDLRTAGMAFGVGGPLVGLSGVAVIAWSQDQDIEGGQALGAVMGAAGIVSVVSAPWLLVASSATARSVSFQTHGRAPSPAAPWVVASLTVGSLTLGTVALSLPEVASSAAVWSGLGGVVLYVSAIAVGIHSSGRHVRIARIPPPRVSLARTQRGTWTVHLGGRF